MELFVVEQWDGLKVEMSVACSDALKVVRMGTVLGALLAA